MTSPGYGLDDDCNSAPDDDFDDDDDSTSGNNLGRQNIAVHGVRGWETLVLHNNQMIRHGSMSFGAANE